MPKAAANTTSAAKITPTVDGAINDWAQVWTTSQRESVCLIGRSEEWHLPLHLPPWGRQAGNKGSRARAPLS